MYSMLKSTKVAMDLLKDAPEEIMLAVPADLKVILKTSRDVITFYEYVVNNVAGTQYDDPIWTLMGKGLSEREVSYYIDSLSVEILRVKDKAEEYLSGWFPYRVARATSGAVVFEKLKDYGYVNYISNRVNRIETEKLYQFVDRSGEGEGLFD